MKRIIINICAALMVLGGLVIGAVGSGVLIFLASIAVTYAGAVSLVKTNTDWLSDGGGE